MIEIRPTTPVQTTEGLNTVIGVFADSEWWDLVELARRYGFDLPDIEVHYPRRPYNHPVELGAVVAQRLYEAISAVWNDGAVPYALTWEESNETSSFGAVELPGEEPEEASIIRETAHEHPEFHVGQTQVKRLMHCAQIGAEHGGIEIQRVQDED